MKCHILLLWVITFARAPRITAETIEARRLDEISIKTVTFGLFEMFVSDVWNQHIRINLKR
jgi:hypothetical protein